MKTRPSGSWLIAASCLALAGPLAQPACAGQDAGSQPDAYAAYRGGEYDTAIRGLRALLRNDPADARARRTLVAALVEVGRYEDAEAAARDAPSPAPLANALGEVLAARGRIDEAEAAFRQAVEAGAPDARTARLNVALLDAGRGRVEPAMTAFDAFIDIYNDAASLTARDLMAVAEAVRRLGVRDPQLYKDALRALDEAIAADDGRIDGAPVELEARVRLGRLFLEKYSSTEAQPLFREVLAINPRHPGALLGMAMAKNFDGSDESLEFVRQSLETNPDDAGALVFRARLLLELERPDEAVADVNRALAVNPRSLQALATRAAAEWLAGDDAAFGATRDRVFALNPAWADLYNQIAELAVRQRRYAGAVDLARQAVQMDPSSWSGWGILGVNQLRLGQVQEASANLAVSFEGDPYNPWIKNTLDLLDTFGEYRVVRTPRFELMLHQSEAELLLPYVTEVAEAARDSLSRRYGWAPSEAVRVEVFPRHADFSVRTVGISGLGALGVCFGNVLAIDSPSARERGAFNWGSVLWHELAHTVTLGISGHRVPRWLTEGLAVLEERRARPGWGDDLTPEFIAAYKKGDILPVSRLSQGFVRPKFPEQVAFSYYQASLVAEFIEELHGFPTILAMLRAYGDGSSDEQVFREVLRIDPEAFDERFDTWFRRRFGPRIAAVQVAGPQGVIGRALGAVRAGAEPASDDLLAQLRRADELAREGQDARARPYFERARDLFPEYVGPGNAYAGLAALHRRAGNARAAAQALTALTARSENDYDANVELAGLLASLDDVRGAVAALERAIFIWPYDVSLHERLATSYAQSGDRAGVVRARRAIVALDPVDRAEALYQLALAYFEAGDRTAARREVVRALELAPNFQKAQELLLRLRSGTRPSPGPDKEAA